MWNSFERALEKRAQTKKQEFDRHTLKQVMQNALDEQFGNMGREFLEIIEADDGVVKILSRKSIWSAEMRLRKEQIRKQINAKYQQEVIQAIIIVN